jgi:hypothetical protein
MHMDITYPYRSNTYVRDYRTKTISMNHLQPAMSGDVTIPSSASTLIVHMRQKPFSEGHNVVQTALSTHRPQVAGCRSRIGDRRPLRVEGRLTWRDVSGALRCVSVVTRNVSDVDAFVECQVPASIPLYRLVHFQIERTGRERTELPPALQQGRVLSAVYRVGPYRAATGTPRGYALRLLVEPGARTNAARKRSALAAANQTVSGRSPVRTAQRA